MLWICLHLPHLPVEVLVGTLSTPTATVDGKGARRRLIACNAMAREQGLRACMSIPGALLREPALQLIDRLPAEERRAIDAIACWAHGFTSDVIVERARRLLWLEVGASLAYFKGLRGVYEQIRGGLSEWGYTATYGIAPTLEAAALLTHEEGEMPILEVIELRARLADLALAHVPVSARTREQLSRAGVTTLGQVFDLSRASLARRFGPAICDYLQRLLGECPDTRPRHRLPATYTRQFEFAEPVASIEGVLFPLNRMLQELQGYLRARDVALQTLAIDLHHCSGQATALSLSTSTPMRAAVQWFGLLRERLERVRLPDAITRIALKADTFVHPNISQRDFFDDRGQRQSDWSALLDKLRARLGEQAIRCLGLRSDHRPEHAWCTVEKPEASPHGEQRPERPLWLLEPKPIAELPPILGTPERIEAGWALDGDVSRDYYWARTAAGAQWWLFRDRTNGQWYLHGLWA